MISLENKRLGLCIFLVLTLSFIVFGCVFIITSSLLMSRVKQFPPIETSVSTTCTVLDPNINCQVQQVDLLHNDEEHVAQVVLDTPMHDHFSSATLEDFKNTIVIATKPSNIHKISSKLIQNAKAVTPNDALHTTKAAPFIHSVSDQPALIQGKCFALVQYDSKNMDKEFSKLESVTYFPHTSSSPQSQYTKGQTVNCYFDEFRPQVVSYDRAKQPMEYVKFYDIMQIAYVELATAGCLFLLAMICLGLSCCCSYMYNRSLREYAGLKASSGSLP
ncbi:hypothetical protein C9374_007836 [Naegleria lovaniensis]|uniref:Uncharacterized protein n=1 Tax=Naegleria lovaniensis TaxID=51637 RepID=A0AA88KIA8_NAELO|nr:uncharacterized protein C9374_007836 [Naegleria lovaniensis]KAG2378688.1 hypothetical protein C9374_007836 [Naegleria lovaniensis]